MRTAEFLRGATPVLEISMPAGAGRASLLPVRKAGPPPLAQAYSSSGGVIGSDAMARLLGSFREQPISVLARWIVDRRVLYFQSDGQLVLPLFQFEFPGLHVVPGVAEVIAELGGCLDDGEIAEWFVRPNCGLHCTSPAAAMAADPGAVLQAARADRFALQG